MTNPMIDHLKIFFFFFFFFFIKKIEKYKIQKKNFYILKKSDILKRPTHIKTN